VVSESVHAQDNLPPQIVHEPCEVYQKGRPYSVVARFYDESPIFDPKVIYRTGKVSDWRNASFRKKQGTDDFVAVIKARDLRGPLDYFIETFDENGNGPARYGNPDAPVRILPSDDAPECSQTGDDSFAPVKSLGSSVREPGEPDEPPDEPSEPPPVGTEAPPAGTASTGPQSTVSAVSADSALTAEAPPPARTGCDADDPPAYCSPILWTAVGIGVVGAGFGGFAIWCWGLDGCSSSTAGVPDEVSLGVSVGDVTGVLP
jgi:hypothetical protein